MDLRAIEQRLRKGDCKGRGRAAREALDTLVASVPSLTDATALRFAVAEPRAVGILFAERCSAVESRWHARCLVLEIKRVLYLFAAAVVQAVWRRFQKRKRSVHVLQTRALQWLYKPSGWAERKGAHELSEIVG